VSNSRHCDGVTRPHAEYRADARSPASSHRQPGRHGRPYRGSGSPVALRPRLSPGLPLYSERGPIDISGNQVH
jgi:hypothetical protein